MISRKLETYKVFPIVAWIVFIGFALFVYGIAVELRDASDALQLSTNEYNTLEIQLAEHEARLRALETE